MQQYRTIWIGLIWFVIFSFIGLRAVHSARKLQKRYIDAIARLTGNRVRAIHRYFDEPNIYTEGSKASRLQKAYLRALRRQEVIWFGLALLWLVFGGWVLATLFDSFLAVSSR